jgi:hypothetical protein
MPERREDLKEQMEILKESIRLRWMDMAALPMQPEQRRELRGSIYELMDEFADLLRRLDAVD